jgi:LmbE family N-acetylglucosaminyl deacetylase
MKKVLVVAAHPDDEILGCGGTIAKLSNSGSHVHILIVAEGITSRDKSRNKDMREKDLAFLQDCGRKASKILGVKNMSFLNYPDNRLDGVEILDITKDIETCIQKIKPDTIFTHYEHDMNYDHTIVSKATLTACRPLPNTTIKNLIQFEVLSSTNYNPLSNFRPNLFVNIEKTIKLKNKALSYYKSEMRRWPHSRSITASNSLSMYRGTSAGVKYAEAFRILRQTV